MADFGKLNFSVSFNPTSGFPLDARYYFDSLEAAQLAASGAVEVGSSDGVYFIGMNLVVVESGSATMYVIQPDKTLKPVGTTPVGDNKTISVGADGTISLLGIADAQTGAYPSKKADGSIEWIKPDTTTVEGLTQEVEALGGRMDTAESDISALKTTVGGAESGLVKQVNDLSTNLSTNYYDKTAVDGLVAGAFHFKGAADSFDGTDIIVDGEPLTNMKTGDVYQVGDKEYAYDGTKWIELGFTLDLSNYALKTYVDSAVSAAKTELQGYADQAETDAINSAKTYTDGKIEALGIGDYAKTAEVTSAIEAAKTEVKQYADQAESDAITAAGTQADSKIAAKVGEIGASTTVKQYVDTKEAALSGQISTISGQISNLGDLAQLDEVGESNLASALATKINGKADKATTLAGYGITDAMTATAITSAISTAKEEAISSAVSSAGSAADSKISAKVGEITGTVKDYVDGKETALSGQIGTINSTISGYGDIVTHNANEFDAAGAAANVLGTAEDASTVNTVHGAKKAAAEALSAAQSAQSTADGKVASVSGADASVTVTSGTTPTVKVNISADEGNALSLASDGLKVALGAAPEYTISKETTADEGYFATYILKKDGAQAGDKINIPKDYLVKSATIEEATEDDPSGLPVGTKYIDFIVNTKAGSGTESHIYLNVNELVDAYTAGNGIEVSGANQISAKVIAGNGLSVDGSGIKMSPASASAAGAMSSAHYSKLVGIAAGAQVNTIESITINGETISPVEKVVGIPLATASKMGVVKADETSLQVSNGVLSVKAVDINLLSQNEGDVLILDCSSSL